MSIIEHEVSQESEIPIPDEVLEKYAIWRPSPLYRAFALEKALGTPAKIYYKNEGVSPAGSHKPNAAIAAAYFNKEAGTKQIYTETGAGQWGSALSKTDATGDDGDLGGQMYTQSLHRNRGGKGHPGEGPG
jgi:tryptophan synthase beta chain